AQAEALMRLAVQLAVEARDAFWAEWQAQPDAARRASRARPLVAASIGPYGAMCADGSEYRGYADRPEVDEAALMAFHRPRLRVLAQAGADLLACETLPCLAEARALARLLDELADGLPARVNGVAVTRDAWISFSCRDGAHTSAGDVWADCVQALAGFRQVAAIGVNCTAPQHVESLVAIAAAHARQPILVYPNAGETYDAHAKRWHANADPALHNAPFADQALRWAQAGARLIGGCCRTTPADIGALAQRWRRDMT
ncbi:MAG: homocysteine S-methyltransferase, partial [Leptothrix sp. (in: b-proteobacteria)]